MSQSEQVPKTEKQFCAENRNIPVVTDCFESQNTEKRQLATGTDVINSE